MGRDPRMSLTRSTFKNLTEGASEFTVKFMSHWIPNAQALLKWGVTGDSWLRTVQLSLMAC